MRIRHLVILVVYVAVALAFVVAVIRAPGPEQVQQAWILGMLIPAILIGSAALLLRPGPHRDWITSFFWSLSMLVLALFCTLPVLIVAWRGQFLAEIAKRGSMVGPAMFYSLISWGGLLFIARWNLTARPCPGCGRRTLVRAANQQEKHRVKAWYHRCTACNQVCRVPSDDRRGPSIRGAGREAMPRPVCPHCGGETLRRIPYQFFWCLGCRSRYKRARRGAWEEAGQPDDDDFYWLWSLEGSLSRVFRRWSGRGGRSEPPR